jgi:transcriptional regulator with XRE-family HTH domain
MATVGERIKKVREARGWTQEKLADESKVSRGFLSEVEKHGKNISLDLLLRIANALGASVGYLATGEGEQLGERKPVVIPLELSQAAEELRLSYPETLELLDAYNSVVARRSNRSKGTMSVKDWKELHAAVKSVIRRVYG